ncbi:MAG: hypothetical protein EZS28_019857, partial [Streblomastix strix]
KTSKDKKQKFIIHHMVIGLMKIWVWELGLLARKFPDPDLTLAIPKVRCHQLQFILSGPLSCVRINVDRDFILELNLGRGDKRDEERNDQDVDGREIDYECGRS